MQDEDGSGVITHIERTYVLRCAERERNLYYQSNYFDIGKREEDWKPEKDVQLRTSRVVLSCRERDLLQEGPVDHEERKLRENIETSEDISQKVKTLAKTACSMK